MSRVDLNVPFSEKDQAKALGAKWDATKKVWYVPTGVSKEQFSQWIEQHIELPKKEPVVTIKAYRYYIAKSFDKCWRCQDITEVFSIAVPNIAVFLENEYDEDDKNSEPIARWVRNVHSHQTFISYPRYFSPSVENRLKQVAPRYVPDVSKTASGDKVNHLFPNTSTTAQAIYWMNHCEHCNAKLGDFYLHHEGCSPFNPAYEEDIEGLILYEIREFFEGDGDGYGGWCSTMDFIYPMIKIIPFQG